MSIPTSQPGKLTVSCAVLVLSAYACAAQYHTAREAESNSVGTPEWKVDEEFKHDVFTFVRIKYHRGYGHSWSAGDWSTDFTDSDLNLSYRLQQMTAMKVDPNGRVLELTNPELFDYP